MIMFVSERVGCIKRKSIIKKTKIKAKQKQNLIKINILNDVYSKKKKIADARQASQANTYYKNSYIIKVKVKKKTISK